MKKGAIRRAFGNARDHPLLRRLALLRGAWPPVWQGRHSGKPFSTIALVPT